MYFPFLQWWRPIPTAWNCTSVVVMSGCLPSGDFLLLSLLPPVSDPWHHGMTNWSEHRPLTRWPDHEPSGWANQLPRDQMGRQTKIVTYPPPSWKCRRAAPEVQEGLIWSKNLPYSEPEAELWPWYEFPTSGVWFSPNPFVRPQVGQPGQQQLTENKCLKVKKLLIIFLFVLVQSAWTFTPKKIKKYMCLLL